MKQSAKLKRSATLHAVDPKSGYRKSLCGVKLDGTHRCNAKMLRAMPNAWRDRGLVECQECLIRIP